MEANSYTPLHDPRKADEEEGTDSRKPKPPRQNGKEAWHHEEAFSVLSLLDNCYTATVAIHWHSVSSSVQGRFTFFFILLSNQCLL